MTGIDENEGVPVAGGPHEARERKISFTGNRAHDITEAAPLFEKDVIDERDLRLGAARAAHGFPLPKLVDLRTMLCYDALAQTERTGQSHEDALAAARSHSARKRGTRYRVQLSEYEGGQPQEIRHRLCEVSAVEVAFRLSRPLAPGLLRTGVAPAGIGYERELTVDRPPLCRHTRADREPHYARFEPRGVGRRRGRSDRPSMRRLITVPEKRRASRSGERARHNASAAPSERYQ